MVYAPPHDSLMYRVATGRGSIPRWCIRPLEKFSPVFLSPLGSDENEPAHKAGAFRSFFNFFSFHFRFPSSPWGYEITGAHKEVQKREQEAPVVLVHTPVRCTFDRLNTLRWDGVRVMGCRWGSWALLWQRALKVFHLSCWKKSCWTKCVVRVSIQEKLTK